MKKEVFIAIFIGLLLGVIITYGVYRARVSIEPTPDQNVINASASPLPDTSPLTSLSITSPEDEIIQSTPGITVTGTTQPDSFVVILVNDDPTITTADQSGGFSVESELETGSNVIAIHSIDEDGNSVVEERTVVYTTQSLEETQPEATQSATTNEENDK